MFGPESRRGGSADLGLVLEAAPAKSPGRMVGAEAARPLSTRETHSLDQTSVRQAGERERTTLFAALGRAEEMLPLWK